MMTVWRIKESVEDDDDGYSSEKKLGLDTADDTRFADNDDGDDDIDDDDNGHGFEEELRSDTADASWSLDTDEKWWWVMELMDDVKTR